MVWVAKCCCCHLKGGVIAIGCVFLVLNALGAASAAMQLYGANTIFQSGAIKDVVNGILGTSLAMYVISAIVSILLFVPACNNDADAKNKRFFLIPWMVWIIVYTLICIGFTVYYLIQLGFSAALFVIVVYLIFIALGIYCEIMVMSYFQHLRDFNPAQQPTGGVVMQQPNAGYQPQYAPQTGYPPQGQPMAMQAPPVYAEKQPNMQ